MKQIDNEVDEVDYLLNICKELNEVANIKTDRQFISYSCLLITDILDKMLSNNDISSPQNLHDMIELCLKHKMISTLEASNINTVRRIRNKFTHTLSIKNFNDIDIINYKNFYIKEKNMPKKDIFRVNIITLMLIDTKRRKGHFTNKKNKDVFTSKKSLDDTGKALIILFSALNKKESEDMISHIVNTNMSVKEQIKKYRVNRKAND
jgi:hypothetical protein